MCVVRLVLARSLPPAPSTARGAAKLPQPSRGRPRSIARQQNVARGAYRSSSASTSGAEKLRSAPRSSLRSSLNNSSSGAKGNALNRDSRAAKDLATFRSRRKGRARKGNNKTSLRNASASPSHEERALQERKRICEKHAAITKGKHVRSAAVKNVRARGAKLSSTAGSALVAKRAKTKSSATREPRHDAVAKEAVKRLPTLKDVGWSVESADGVPFYWNEATQTSQWEHPWMAQGGRVKWLQPSSSGVNPVAVSATIISAIYRVHSLESAIQALRTAKDTGTDRESKSPSWPVGFVVDLMVDADPKCSTPMYRRIVDKVPVSEVECIAPPKQALADKRRQVAAGWTATIVADTLVRTDDDTTGSEHEPTIVALCPKSHTLQGAVASCAMICDACETALGHGTVTYGCRRCDYDLCTRCYKEPLLQNCPGKHGLLQADTADFPQLRFLCDLCDTPVKGTIHRCKQCDFDICSKCHREPRLASCPGGHDLKGVRTPDDGYTCDRCHKQCPAKSLLYGCRRCDYDLCWTCYVKADAAKTERLRVSDVFERAFLAYGPRPCIGFEASGHTSKEPSSELSKWVWITYDDVFQLMRGIGAVLDTLGISRGRYIGMSGANSPSYIVVYLALISGGWKPVALSLHLSDSAAGHILQEAELAAVFVESGPTQQRYEDLAKAAENFDVTSPGAPVCVPEVLSCLHLEPAELSAWILEHTSDLNTSHDSLKPTLSQPTQREDLETPLLILYTSGSTGKPKGALMSERSFLYELKDMVRTDDADNSGVSQVDAPIATSATPYNMAGVLVTGGRLPVYPELVRVFDVAAEVGPTAMGLVPQLWAVFYKRFQQELCERVADAKTEQEKAQIEAELRAEYRLQRLGWRVGAVNCGGATPMPLVQKWLKSVYESNVCSVTENYASTEAGPITTSYGDEEGVVSAGVEIKLVDWGEYKSSDKPFPRGELLVRSAAMSTGYLNRPDLTASTFDTDGFYHTGDVVELVDEGPPKRVRVVDRCKNIFKLLNGEWVSPENVEAELMARCPSIKQIMIHGTSKHEYVVAVVVPARAGSKGSDTTAVKRRILDELQLAGQKDEAGGLELRNFEIPHDFVLASSLDDGFSADNGMLTQTNKLCRPAIRRQYKVELDELLVDQHDKIESRKAEQQNVMVAILKKYVALRQGGKANGEISVDPADEAEWVKLEWNSMAATYNHAVIQMHFKGTDSLNIADVWNQGHGLSINALVDRIIAASTNKLGNGPAFGSSIDWKQECAVTLPKVQPLSMETAIARLKPIVFVTGCTGFLGAPLLDNIVQACGHQDVEIWCLVRVKTKTCTLESAARERLIHSLDEREQMTDGVRAAIDRGTNNGPDAGTPSIVVRAVSGDLGEPQLGMSEETFHSVGRRLVCVVHCGSFVNHVFDYHTLRPQNSDSVVELARCATLAPSPPDIIYVSTISVVDADATEETVGDEAYINRSGGYAQSKWVAEMRLRHLAATSQSPFRTVTIVRPGLIGFDTRSGSANTTDWFVRFLVGSMQIGGVTFHARPSTINMTPVNHAAQFIATVMRRRCRICRRVGSVDHNDSGSAIDTAVSTLHLPLTVQMDTQLFVELFIDCATDNGRKMRVVGSAEWRGILEELPRDNSFWPFRDQFQSGLTGVEGHLFALTQREYNTDKSVEDPREYTRDMISKLVEFLLRREPRLRRRLLLRTLSAKPEAEAEDGEETIEQPGLLRVRSRPTK